SPTAVASYLRALWAATEVQTVALFASDGGHAFTIEAALSHSPAVRREGRFDGELFLDAVSPERPMTVLEEGDPLLRDLPYYKSGVHTSAVGVLPVAVAEGTEVFLVVDLPPDQPAFTERQRTLLLGFADLLGQMLALPPEERPAQAPPSRRSIIAEEMARARAEGRPLALAIVYRPDAEAVEQEGPAAVAAAERELRLHLEDLVRDGRVERFGEQMYGVFLYEEPAQLERWAGRVRTRAADEGIPVAIGIARLADHHTDADALRADAVNALQVALADERPFAVVD
ncbi:MAG: hypothetical protein R3362_05535, partial [Rhodothermales bacterium]|nr:hypothetical protein [Rhodothermales bacterium]